MSNIYLEVAIEQNERSQNFDFLGLKSVLSGEFLGSSNPPKYHWIIKLLVST